MARKYKKTEKIIIEMSRGDKYRVYDCPEHGIYSVRQDIEDNRCPYCKKEGIKYEY